MINYNKYINNFKPMNNFRSKVSFFMLLYFPNTIPRREKSNKFDLSLQ